MSTVKISNNFCYVRITIMDVEKFLQVLFSRVVTRIYTLIAIIDYKYKFSIH